MCRSSCRSFWQCVTLCAILFSFTFANDFQADQVVIPLVEQYRFQPLAFTENAGQWPNDVFYRATDGGPVLWFTQEGITYQFSRRRQAEQVVDIPNYAQGESKFEHLLVTSRFVGANSDYGRCGENLMEYKCNYFIGNDPSLWRTDVPNYESILLKGVYDGIDIHFYGNGKAVEYDFIVSAGADPSQIELEYDQVKDLRIDLDGNLIIETEWGTMSQSKPVVFQQTDDGRKSIEGEFVLTDDYSVRFEITNGYDIKYALFIDPVLTYSTYLGGIGNEAPNDIAVSPSGNVFVCGYTGSSDFPAVNAYDNSPNGTADCFVTKFAPSGTSLVYSTFVGGLTDDIAQALSLVGDVVYFAGYTLSSNYPTFNGDGSLNGFTDGIVTALGPAGNTISYSSYIGGGVNEVVHDIVAVCPPPCLANEHRVWIVGETGSSNFPTVNAYDATQNGGLDGFIVNYNINGLVVTTAYSTYFGGNGTDIPNAIAIKNGTDPCITGQTTSGNLPLVNPIDNTIAGPEDAFVTCFAVAGNGSIFPTFSTYLGGGDDLPAFFERATAILVRPSGNVCIVGETCSIGLGTGGVFDHTHNGNEDVFVAEYDPTTPAYVFGAYLGGSGTDVVGGSGNLVTDAQQNLYFCGLTSSANLPVTNAIDASLGGTNDVFVAKISPTGSVLNYCSYLGGSSGEFSPKIAVDSTGCVYVAGATSSTDLTVVTPYDGSANGGDDAFLTKFCIPIFVCGDADGSGVVSISDAVYLINYIFSGGPAPNPLEAGDVDCSGTVTISDAVYLINYIFASGAAPCANCP